MKISISGTHSSGKTVLALALAKSLKGHYGENVALIEEVARQVIAKGLPLNQDATIHSYINYIMLQLKAERNASPKRYVVSDRSLVDLLAYVWTNADDKIPRHFVEMLEELLWVESNYFDLYVYLPIEFALVSDNVRPDDERYRQMVAHTFERIFSTYDLRVIEATGSIENRVDIIIGRLEKK